MDSKRRSVNLRAVGHTPARPSRPVVPDTPIALPLESGIAFYLAHLAEWVEHRGRHALIRGQTLYGFYPTRDAALAEGLRQFGHVSFLVKQVVQDEAPRSLVGVSL